MRRTIRATTVAALLLVLAAPTQAVAGGGGHCAAETARATGASATVDMREACFLPTVLHVGPGTEVTFRNSDPFRHNISGPQGTFGGELFKDFGRGDELKWTFDEPGTYPYMCYLHPGMAGAIVVGDGVPLGAVEEIDAELTGAATSRDDGGSSSVPLGLGLGIAVVLLLAAIASLARRRAPATT